MTQIGNRNEGAGRFVGRFRRLTRTELGKTYAVDFRNTCAFLVHAERWCAESAFPANLPQPGMDSSADHGPGHNDRPQGTATQILAPPNRNRRSSPIRRRRFDRKNRKSRVTPRRGPLSAVSEVLLFLVTVRAGNCCEYCRLPAQGQDVGDSHSARPGCRLE